MAKEDKYTEKKKKLALAIEKSRQLSPSQFFEAQKKNRQFYQKEREYAQDEKQIEFEKRQQRYAGSVGSKIARGFGAATRFVQPGGATRFFYRKSIPPKPILGEPNYGKRKRTGFNRRGRPVGTTQYRDPRTGQKIGVYEYRKIDAELRRERRLKAVRENTVTPFQRQVIMNAEARRAAQMQDPERRVFPDTRGQINMENYMKEISDAANLVD